MRTQHIEIMGEMKMERLFTVNFSENYGFLSENSNGLWRVEQFNSKNGDALFLNPSSFSRKIAYNLFNGKFTFNSLKPRKSYRKVLDRYVYHSKGAIRIFGQYPFYVASDGRPVWIDYDRSFSPTPVDFIERKIEWFVLCRRKGVNANDSKIHIERRDNFYHWEIRVKGKMVRWGTATNRVQAEVRATVCKKRLDGAAKLA